MVPLLTRSWSVKLSHPCETEHSLWWRKPEERVIQTLEGLGTSLVPSSPIGKGFLADKVDSNKTFIRDNYRIKLLRFGPEAMKAKRELVELIGRITVKMNDTLAQIARVPATAKLSHLSDEISAVAMNLLLIICLGSTAPLRK